MVVPLALRPMAYVVPEITAAVGSTVTTTPFCVIVLDARVAACTAE